MNKLLTLSLAASLLPAVGCATVKYDVDTKDPATAGDAHISVKTNKADTREVNIEVEHLPPPARIDASYQQYIVWFTPKGLDPVKAGKLDYDEKDRVGTLMATTPYTAFRLTITLEADPNVAAPMGPVVLDKDVVSKK